MPEKFIILKRCKLTAALIIPLLSKIMERILINQQIIPIKNMREEKP